MAQQKKKIILWAAITLLVIELIVIVIFFDRIIELLSHNWWKSATALIAGVSIRALVVNITIVALIERTKLHFIEEILERSVKKAWFRKTKCVTIKIKRDVRQRWIRYTKLEKIVIITGFFGITMILIGFILYLPLGRKQGLKLAHKKVGGGILKKVVQRQYIITAVEFIALTFRKIRKEEKKEDLN